MASSPWLLAAAAGLLLIAGVLMALYRRFVMRPAVQETTADDALLLAFLLVLAVEGFVLQAMRLALTQDGWSGWSLARKGLGIPNGGDTLPIEAPTPPRCV